MGEKVGLADGTLLGLGVGAIVGGTEGVSDGLLEGFPLGTSVGAADVGDADGGIENPHSCLHVQGQF